MCSVIFHASWCGWCKKLDAFLDDKDMGALMKSGFVIVHIDVLEQNDDEPTLHQSPHILVVQKGIQLLAPAAPGGMEDHEHIFVLMLSLTEAPSP